MRRLLLLVVLGTAALSLLFVQSASANSAHSAGARPLSAQEGRTIVRETSWVEDTSERTTDCSHLVHDIYEQAGYPYPYASSRDLYLGSGNFLRVHKPQAGDLIVWRGHVGIVVNPREHSFFSSVNSGLRTEAYNSAYWRARGMPRFYRYLTDSPLKAGRRTTERASRSPEQESAAPGARGSSVSYGPILEAVKTQPTKVPAQTAQSEDAGESGGGAAIAQQIVLHISGKQPTAADVAQGFADVSRDVGEILQTGNLEQLARPVIIYQDLRVTDLAIKGKHGSARVEVDCIARLAGGQMDSRRDGEQFGLELQRTKKGWVMNSSTENTFVSRDVAMRVLAARLVPLTQREDATAAMEREQGQIIRLLSLLVAEN